MRLLVAPLILLVSGLAPLYQWRETRWRDFAGWLSPEMEPHWQRLFAERTQHAAKNVLSEWVRLDPQRAGKLFSFLLIVVAILGVLL